MVQCEIDISKYISPKSAIFMMMMKTYYVKYNKNKLTSGLNKLDNKKMQELNLKFPEL